MFSIRLQSSLDRKGMMPGELATKANVSKGYVSSLLNGKKTGPSAKICRKFSEVLEVDHMWLLRGEHGEGMQPAVPPILSEEETPYRFVKSQDNLVQRIVEVRGQIKGLTGELDNLLDLLENQWGKGKP